MENYSKLLAHFYTLICLLHILYIEFNSIILFYMKYWEYIDHNETYME